MITFYSQNVWNSFPTSYRNTLISSLISDFDADICVFQECGPKTTRSGEAPLPELLEDTYAEVCPDIADSNYTPVFYKKDKFDVPDSGYFLYDGLNDSNSKSVTWAVLKEKASSVRFAAVSTHFWWMSESEKDNEQRLKNVDQLYELCESVIKKYDVPVIIGGDFNNGKNAEQGDEPYKYMLQKGFCDIRLGADETTDEYTHHDYPILNEDGTFEKGALPKRNLDYIFTYGIYPVKAKKFDVITSQKALDSSDHCPLIGELEFFNS